MESSEKQVVFCSAAEPLCEWLFGGRASRPCLSWWVFSQRIYSAGLRDRCWVIFTHSHVSAARNKKQLHAVTPSTDAKSIAAASVWERLTARRCGPENCWGGKDGTRKLVYKQMKINELWLCCVFVFEFGAVHQQPRIKVGSNLSGIWVLNEKREGREKKKPYVHSLRRLPK